MKNTLSTIALLALIGTASSANAIPVEIRIVGEVEFNQINVGPLAAASGGDSAEMILTVDSTDFVDSNNFPVRGYSIVGFSFTAGGNTVNLADPVPGGATPYFVLRNDDPGVDGFFTGTNVDGFPNGIPSDSDGLFGPFTPNFSVAYDQDPLDSLDILGALGTYDFGGGLTSFNFVVNDGGFDAMGLVFESMTITAVPLPAAVWLFGGALLSIFGLGRRAT